jgi:hypothetical protein
LNRGPTSTSPEQRAVPCIEADDLDRVERARCPLHMGPSKDEPAHALDAQTRSVANVTPAKADKNLVRS